MPSKRPFLIVFVLLAAGGQALAQAGSWSEIAPMPTPRRLHAAAAEGGNFYVFGGCGSPCFGPPFHTSAEEETTVEVYSPQGGWSKKKTRMPTILFGAAAAAPGNGKIYTFGGYVSGNVVQEYDPGSDTWKIKKPMPTPRFGLAAVALEGRIYVLGGSGPSAALEIYNPKENTWISGPPMPTPRVFLAAAVLDRKIYAIGGSPDCCGSSQTDAVEIYDPDTKRWETGPRLPSARQVSAAVGVNGKAYVFGGFIPGSGVQADTLVYDPRTGCRPEAKVTSGTQESTCRPDRPTRIQRPPVDLVCEKTGPLFATPGERLTYQVTIRNLGCEPALNVDVGDPAPAGLTPDCGPAPAPCSRRIAKIPPLGSVKVPFAFQVPEDYQDAGIFNQAQVSQAQTQETPAASANNACTATTPVRCLNPFQNPGDPPAALPLGTWGIVEGPAETVAGRTIEYRILLVNGGPGPQPDSLGHELEHLIPFGLALTGFKADLGQLQLSPAVSGDPTTALLWDGAIPLCKIATILVQAKVLGEPGSEACLQGLITFDADRNGTNETARLTGLRGRIDRGEPLCVRILPGPPV